MKAAPSESLPDAHVCVCTCVCMCVHACVQCCWTHSRRHVRSRPRPACGWPLTAARAVPSLRAASCPQKQSVWAVVRFCLSVEAVVTKRSRELVESGRFSRKAVSSRTPSGSLVPSVTGL